MSEGLSTSSYGQFDPYSEYPSSPQGGVSSIQNDLETGRQKRPPRNSVAPTPSSVTSHRQSRPSNAAFSVAHPPPDREALLNQCRDIDEGMNVMEDLIHNLRIAHNKILDSADELQDNAVRVEAESLAEEIKTLYRSMTERMKTIKRSPGAGTQRNRSQIDKVQRHLGAAIQSYHEVELEFRQGMEEQMVRSYRIVNPDATDEELQAAMANPDDQQIFAKAMMQTDRRGEAIQVSSLVRQRQQDIQQIEQDVYHLEEMFQDMDALIIQQDETTAHIEEQGAQVVEDTSGGNKELASAIDLAKGRNRKKWWCFLIVVLIIVVIVIVIAVPVAMTSQHK